MIQKYTTLSSSVSKALTRNIFFYVALGLLCIPVFAQTIQARKGLDFDGTLNILIDEDRMLPASFLGGIQLVMKQGTLLPIRLDDPGNALIANESKANGSHVLIGMSMGNGVFMPAPQMSDSKTPAGRDFQVLIPLDTDVKLVVASKIFQVTDPNGKPMRDGQLTTKESENA